jgi:hypothetical protein
LLLLLLSERGSRGLVAVDARIDALGSLVVRDVWRLLGRERRLKACGACVTVGGPCEGLVLFFALGLNGAKGLASRRGGGSSTATRGCRWVWVCFRARGLVQFDGLEGGSMRLYDGSEEACRCFAPVAVDGAEACRCCRRLSLCDALREACCCCCLRVMTALGGGGCHREAFVVELLASSLGRLISSNDRDKG